MERDSFTMPKDEYAQIALMKARLAQWDSLQRKVNYYVRALNCWLAMSDNTLKITLAKIPVIKTGRPNKKS